MAAAAGQQPIEAGTTELSTSPIATAPAAAASADADPDRKRAGRSRKEPDLDDLVAPAFAAGYKNAKAMIEGKKSFEPLVTHLSKRTEYSLALVKAAIKRDKLRRFRASKRFKSI